MLDPVQGIFIIPADTTSSQIRENSKHISHLTRQNQTEPDRTRQNQTDVGIGRWQEPSQIVWALFKILTLKEM